VTSGRCFILERPFSVISWLAILVTTAGCVFPLAFVERRWWLFAVSLRAATFLISPLAEVRAELTIPEM
jgi:hypothetical protein